MEPVTHFLTGACLGRAGFNRKTAYATLAAVLAAEAADVDVFWGFAGPVEELKHHRGITHTFWAVPVVAGVVVGAVGLFHFWRQRNKHMGAPPFSSAPADEKGGIAQSPEPHVQPRQPIRWGWLYLTAFVAALSHLLLDWTNNYGLRPFFPFNPRWYAGSFLFIVEPVLWAIFFVSLVMPWLLGLADREIGARREPFRGRGWAIFALVAVLLLGCWRWAEHAQALAMLDNTNIAAEPVTRMAVEPYPVNPFRWHAILETADFYQTAEIDTRTGSIDSDQAGRHPGGGSCQAHAVGPGLSRLGNLGRGARRGSGTSARHGPSATAPQSFVDDRRVHRSALRLCIHRNPQRRRALAA